VLVELSAGHGRARLSYRAGLPSRPEEVMEVDSGWGGKDVLATAVDQAGAVESAHCVECHDQVSDLAAQRLGSTWAAEWGCCPSVEASADRAPPLGSG
jgi:hypothetical protein